MKLINADDIEKKMLVQPWYDSRDEDSALYALLQANIVEAEPIVHGRWIDNKLNGYKWSFFCSECEWTDGFPFNERHLYCPNCGAKMDGEQNKILDNTVQAELIVHCRDCKSANICDDMGNDFYECLQNGVTVFCKGNHFCSYGKQREQENEK